MNVHIDIYTWKTESESSYDVSIKPFVTIANNFIKIISSEESKLNSHINIGVVTHSQIMQESDRVIFNRFILALKEAGVKIIAISKGHLGQE